MTPEVKKDERTSLLARRLGWLIIGRLATAIALLAVGAFLIRDSADTESWQQKLPVFLLVVLLTIAYALAQRFSSNFILQARLQFAVDIFLVTWLVWNSDVLHSPYTALYIVTIAVAGLFLGPRDAMVISIVCAVAFTACALAVIKGWANHPASANITGSLSQSIQSVGLFD